jgi:hypothetical protein
MDEEVPMKKFLIPLCLVPVLMSSPAAARICLSQHDILGTDSRDGKNLTFRMRDGRVLVNHLQGTCSDLRYNGFVWVLRGTDDICENEQSLRVLRSGQVCVLGKFDPAKPAMSKAP